MPAAAVGWQSSLQTISRPAEIGTYIVQYNVRKHLYTTLLTEINYLLVFSEENCDCNCRPIENKSAANHFWPRPKAVSTMQFSEMYNQLVRSHSSEEKHNPTKHSQTLTHFFRKMTILSQNGNYIQLAKWKKHRYFSFKTQ